MKRIYNIALFTYTDLFRSKLFYIMIGLSILMLLTVKGCYNGNFSVNGKQVSEVEIAWYIMKISFHVIAALSLLISILLSSKIFKNSDGTSVYILSKPVKRYEYATARILGAWLISFTFMFLMHSAISIFSIMEVDASIQNYFISSLVCSVNLLFTVVLTSLIAIKLPDSAAVVSVCIICGISFVSDLTQKVMESEIAKQVAGDSIPLPSIWRQLFPQIFSLQFFSVKFMDQTASYPHHGLFHPLLNIGIYIIILYSLTLFVFRREEIS